MVKTTSTAKPKKQSKVPPTPQASRKQSPKTEAVKERIVTESVASRKSSHKADVKKGAVKSPKEAEVAKEEIVVTDSKNITGETINSVEEKSIEIETSENTKAQPTETESEDSGNNTKEESLIPPLSVNESPSEFIDSTVAGVDSDSFKEGTIELINIFRNSESSSPLISYATSYDDQYLTTLPPPVMQTLGYEVIHATSWDESYPPQQLLPKDNKNNGNDGGIKHGKGWQSEK
ncbi:7737_t:CDS:1 [Acaulospora colombiana]|uniref:7737_t:CDS:1 n=1 Tax=Acaulospora colombiana TaxID=27376 RepID=A0ACA9K5S4_9GLOM|nr:7737_t:CDS:1 [Acaulospora colombiana]